MTKLSASEAFVETLAAQGVTDIFGIVGTLSICSRRPAFASLRSRMNKAQAT
jgi:hypothetical protein